MGNLAPSLMVAVLLSYGIWQIQVAGEIFSTGLWFVAAAPIAGWLGANFLGLYQNEAMKREIAHRYRQSKGDALPAHAEFVGMATPAFQGLLDPHEDVGFLIVRDDKIEYFGEKHVLQIPRSALMEVKLGPNVHSWLLLGGWVVMEGRVGDKHIRLLLEPRKYRTLLQNNRYRRELVRLVSGPRSSSNS